MKLSDVVRGVEEKDLSGYREGHGRGSEGHYLEYGYNSLASAEVVVDREKIKESIRKWEGGQTLIKINYDSLAQAIATAIESGEIISLKEEE